MRIHPESQSRRYLDWLREHPPVVHLAPAVVGPPDPRLVPRRRGDLRRPRAARGRRLGARPRRARHLVLLGAVAVRDARLARGDAELRAFYPTDVLSTARDILFLWVARMVMMGLEFTGDVPFDDVYVHSVIQAPDGRRMSKSLGTGIDPLDEIDAHGADAVRFGLLAMSSHAGRALLRREGPPGPGAGQQALQRRALRAAATSSPRPSPSRARRRSRTAGSSAACRRPRRSSTRTSPPSTSPRPRSGSTTSSTASCATGTSSSTRAASTTHEPVGDDAARPARDAAARAPGHPLRDRGAVVARARRRGPAGRAAGDRARRRRCATPMPRRAWAP